jgi:hypothetical protein
MGQPDSSDLRVRVAIPYTIESQGQYFNDSYPGVWLTEYGMQWAAHYVKPNMPGHRQKPPPGYVDHAPGSTQQFPGGLTAQDVDISDIPIEGS